MTTPLRVLIVEDSEDDASLLLRALRRGGYEPICRQVDTREAMASALEEQEWEIVIADYSMPSFSGLAALSLLRAKGLDLPFIVVSGAIGEELAVEAMKAGAHDYVMKGNLHRLIPAIERELREAAMRREHRLAEEARRESDRRFRRITENALDMIFRYEVAPTPCFAYMSPAATRMTGYTPEEHYADPDLHTKLVHPDDRRAIRGLSSVQVVARSQPIRWRHKDGRIVWVEKRIVPIHEGGRLVAMEGIIRDITERKQMEERILRAERLETAGQIAGQVAHDFNNLLTPLAGYPQLIKRKLPEGHPAVRYCDIMVQSVQQMSEINEDLLALGRRGHFEQQPVDLNQVVEQSAENISRASDSLEVRLELNPDLMPVKGASAQLLRVVTNLLSNAREAMQDAGTLTVRTDNVYVDQPRGAYSHVEVGEYVRLDVADTGSGVAPEIRDRIFDAFFTTKVSGKRRGSGLGLSVVQAIVEDHRGHVELESAVGKGSIFSIYLPVCREPLKLSPADDLRGGAESILVVDDDPLQREVAKELLEAVGYRVETVGSGEEAAVYVAERPVDLLILDMIMPPGIDGTETFRRVREARPGQRAIIVSGFAESEQVREAQRLGAGGYVRKPISLEKLARAIREELDRAALDRVPKEPGLSSTQAAICDAHLS